RRVLFRSLHRFSEYKDVIYGGLLVIAVLVVPEGLVGVARRVRSLIGTRRAAGGRGRRDTPPPSRRGGKETFPPRTPPIGAELRSASAAIRGSRLRRRERPAETRVALRAECIRVRFGGVVA